MTMLQFESASELRAHYAGVRARLYPQRVRFELQPVVVELPPPPLPAPVVDEQAPPIVEVMPAKDEDQGKITIRRIQRAVCEKYRVSYIDLISHRRTSSVTEPRHIAMWMCKQLTTLSLPAIARHFDGRDHTTILSAIRKIDKKMPLYEDIIAEIRGAL